MGDVIRMYGDHPEFKSLGPNNLICAKETIGLLRRRTVIAKPIFKFIGKEVDRGTSEDAYVMEGEKLVRYQNAKLSPFPRALRDLSNREVSQRSGFDAETISRERKREKVRPQTHAKLMRFATRLKVLKQPL